MKILTFGEILLRLKPPGLERFFQSPIMEASFGGGEANVAVSLANFGMDVQYCTVLPNNVIGDECIKELRQFGVDVSKVKAVQISFPVRSPMTAVVPLSLLHNRSFLTGMRYLMV